MSPIDRKIKWIALCAEQRNKLISFTPFTLFLDIVLPNCT